MTKKAYTDQEEQIARFAKAMGHPAADGYSAIPCQAGQLLFRGYSRSVADCQSDRIAASKGVERGRIDTG